jgi:hypothetical protein
LMDDRLIMKSFLSEMVLNSHQWLKLLLVTRRRPAFYKKAYGIIRVKN